MAKRSDWPPKIYKSLEEADAADAEFYAKLTPQERLRMMFEIIGDNDPEPRLDRVPQITKRPRG